MGIETVKRTREGRASALQLSSCCPTFPGGSTLPARAEPRPGVRQDAAFHRRHGLIPGGASTSSSEAPRAAPPIELVLDVPGRLNVPRGRRSQGLDVLLPPPTS